jgi:N-dimethylarginine dimethylaminohydrolase
MAGGVGDKPSSRIRKEKPMAKQRIVNVNNEYGKLRDAFIGIGDRLMMDPPNHESLKWQDETALEWSEQYGGKLVVETRPGEVETMQEQFDNLAKILKGRGIEVFRSHPLRYDEEITYLDNVHRGYCNHDGCDFFLTIGNNVILLNNLRTPCRRKRVWAIRDVVEPVLKNSNARYVAMPPCSPHYLVDDMYLERGDVFVDGYNVFAGFSGNASSRAGIDWLQQFLGEKYKVYTVKLHPKILHLDTVCMLHRPGLLTCYPEFLIDGLPEPLKKWEKIEIKKLDTEQEAFGANGLMLSPEVMIHAKQYERLVPEYEKRGIEVITIPFDVPIHWGVGVRCAVGPLRRDDVR